MLLSAKALRKEYRTGAGFLGQMFGGSGSTVKAVDGIELRVDPGECVALVGESGSGKTTAGKLVTRLETPSGGKIVFDGVDVASLSGAALKAFRRRVQMIFQNPYESLDPRYTIGQSVIEPLELHRIGDAVSRREAAEAALGQVELRPTLRFFDRYPTDMSGGQLQRVSIARTLVLQPRLIVADEPVSMLDVSVRSGIMNLMLKLQAELGIAYLFITHDLAVARYMAQRIAVMYLGVIVEEGPADTLMTRAAHPYTRLLIAAVPDHGIGRRRERVRLKGEAAAVKEIPPGCRFHPRCPMAQDICRSQAPAAKRLADGHWAACHFADEVAALDKLSDAWH